MVRISYIPCVVALMMSINILISFFILVCLFHIFVSLNNCLQAIRDSLSLIDQNSVYALTNVLHGLYLKQPIEFYVIEHSVNTVSNLLKFMVKLLFPSKKLLFNFYQ